MHDLILTNHFVFFFLLSDVLIELFLLLILVFFQLKIETKSLICVIMFNQTSLSQISLGHVSGCRIVVSFFWDDLTLGIFVSHHFGTLIQAVFLYSNLSD